MYYSENGFSDRDIAGRRIKINNNALVYYGEHAMLIVMQFKEIMFICKLRTPFTIDYIERQEIHDDESVKAICSMLQNESAEVFLPLLFTKFTLFDSDLNLKNLFLLMKSNGKKRSY
jgi:hypothetical protein